MSGILGVQHAEALSYAGCLYLVWRCVLGLLDKHLEQALCKTGLIPAGRARISQAMQLCPGAKLSSSDDVIALRDWVASAFDYMAMGNFPYSSS